MEPRHVVKIPTVQWVRDYGDVANRFQLLEEFSPLSTTPTPLPFESLDHLLAQHPFGNTHYITEQLHVCYRRRLGKVSAHLPVAGQLFDLLCRAEPYSQYRLFGDTAVRCALQHALTLYVLQQAEEGTQYGLPLEQCEEVFQATIRLLEEGRYGALASGLTNRLGSGSHHGWIWSEERSSDVFAQTFRHVVYNVYNGDDEQLCTPNADEIAVLVKGAQLLSELLPLSSSSALSHVHLIAVFPPVGSWKNRASSSEFTLSGTVFLNRDLLSSPWLVAEHLFHEALHQQLYDFRRGHSLLMPDFDKERTICSLWNVPDSTTHDNYWDVHRALAALHVYVHLALLSTLAEQRAPDLEEVYGTCRMVRSRTALARAHYLNEQIRALSWQELGSAGKRYVDWFTSVLEIIDPSPPPQGSYIHLLLDRYRREAREVELLLNKAEGHADVSSRLLMLAKDEVKSVRRVLVAMNAQADLVQFNDALAPVFDEEALIPSHEELGKQFVRVRSLGAKTILDLSPDGYTLSDSRAPDEIVRQMVESSSESLKTLVGR